MISRLALTLLLAIFSWAPVAASAKCRGDKASAPPQIDSSGAYSFAYFRLDELGRRMYCDEVTASLPPSATTRLQLGASS